MTDNALLQRIDGLLDRDDLSAWEADFVEAMQAHAKAGRELTEKQLDKLEEIEERVDD